ncbi:MAG TPA: hypothetical protein VKR32_16620 [Puia sp.]|nr:hypothetical protein [Puia sp.]
MKRIFLVFHQSNGLKPTTDGPGGLYLDGRQIGLLELMLPGEFLRKQCTA